MSRGCRVLNGKSGPIRIERDEHGVVQITAQDLNDALFGQGYCHARDRGLQMRLVRIIGRGQASRRLQASEEMLEIDRFFRRLNFLADAASEEQALDPATRAGCEAYTRGVNAAFERHGVPWELAWLGDRARGDLWTFADIYLTAKVIGYVSLAMSQQEMERWIVECVQFGITRAHLEELFPGQLGGLDEELVRRVRLQERLVPAKLWKTPALPLVAASNNWVIAGIKTVSGQPLACNDPHLQINRLPAIWYESVLRWNSGGEARYAMGATLPGTPGVTVGRNNDLAWSVTYAFMDCVDSWIEECRDGHYRRGEDWLPFADRDEVIERKGKPSVTVRFYENDHGTLEGDPFEPGFYLSSRWSGGEHTGASSLAGLFGVLEARSAAEGRSCLGRLCNSSWNWLFADRNGSIAYQMAGKLPVRRPQVSGLVPLPGWDAENDWQGFCALEDLPRCVDPPEGFLATANDDQSALGRSRPVNLTLPPYRAERIRAVLSGPGPFTIADMKTLQFDIGCTQAERFLRLLRPLLTERGSSENARTLREWDGSYAEDSRAPTLFERFYRELLEEVFSGESAHCDEAQRLGSSVITHLVDETALFAAYYAVFDRVLLAERSVWFCGRSRDEVYRTVLDRILDEPAEPYGTDHQFELKHLILGDKLPRFLGFNRGPIPLRGGRATVHQGQIMRERGRDLVCGPSYRYVTDLGTDELHTALPGGASDRRFSPWYANGLYDWLNGVYKVLHGRRESMCR